MVGIYGFGWPLHYEVLEGPRKYSISLKDTAKDMGRSMQVLLGEFKAIQCFM